MELDITTFVMQAAPMDYSASIAEIGANAGRDTWNAACEDSEDYMILDTEDKREAFCSIVISSGGWEANEIASWSDKELNALCIQWVAGDIREAGIESDWTPAQWAEYESDENNRGNIYRGNDGKVYFYCGE